MISAAAGNEKYPWNAGAKRSNVKVPTNNIQVMYIVSIQYQAPCWKMYGRAVLKLGWADRVYSVPVAAK